LPASGQGVIKWYLNKLQAHHSRRSSFTRMRNVRISGLGGRPHLWETLRYTELNPVRAQLVTEAHTWAWSSTAAHCATVQADRFLSTEPWQDHWTNTSWREYLAAGETETELASIRQCTHTGRPLGTREFVHSLEESVDRGWFRRRAVDRPKRDRIQDNQILRNAST